MFRAPDARRRRNQPAAPCYLARTSGGSAVAALTRDLGPGLDALPWTSPREARASLSASRRAALQGFRNQSGDDGDSFTDRLPLAGALVRAEEPDAREERTQPLEIVDVGRVDSVAALSS